ncbi:MAG: hypothetical protein EAX96_14410 [Candidatus Lokiarchaeota archaeon]|nr:hypothetical protein [Candidatus Lokiarchaeota archaeon]
MYSTNHEFFMDLRRRLDEFREKDEKKNTIRKELCKRYIYFLRNDVQQKELEKLPDLKLPELLTCYIRFTYFSDDKFMLLEDFIDKINDSDVDLFITDSVLGKKFIIKSSESVRKEFVKRLEQLKIFVVSYDNPYLKFKMASDEFYEKTHQFLSKLKEFLERPIQILPREDEKRFSQSVTPKKPVAEKKTPELFDLADWLLSDWLKIKFNLRNLSAGQLDFLIRLETHINVHRDDLYAYLFDPHEQIMTTILKKSTIQANLALLKTIYSLDSRPGLKNLINLQQFETMLQSEELCIHFTRHYKEYLAFIEAQKHLKLIHVPTLVSIVNNFDKTDQLLSFLQSGNWVRPWNNPRSSSHRSQSDFFLLKIYDMQDVVETFIQKINEIFSLSDYMALTRGLHVVSDKEKIVLNEIIHHALNISVLQKKIFEASFEQKIKFFDSLRFFGKYREEMLKRLVNLNELYQNFVEMLENSPLNDEQLRSFLIDSFEYLAPHDQYKVRFFTPKRVRLLQDACTTFALKSLLLELSKEYSIALESNFVEKVKQEESVINWNKFQEFVTKKYQIISQDLDWINKFYPHYKNIEDVKQFLREEALKSFTIQGRLDERLHGVNSLYPYMSFFGLCFDDLEVFSKVQDAMLAEPDLYVFFCTLTDFSENYYKGFPEWQQFISIEVLKNRIISQYEGGKPISIGDIYNIKKFAPELVHKIDWMHYFTKNFEAEVKLGFRHLSKVASEIEQITKQEISHVTSIRSLMKTLISEKYRFFFNDEEVDAFIKKYVKPCTQEEISQLKKFQEIMQEYRFFQ